MAKRFAKLAKMFDTALNDSFVGQTIPSFDKIVVFLEKNKKKSHFYDELLQFYFYLQTFNVESEDDNRQVNSSPFAISGKSTEEYRQLLTKVESFLFSNTVVLEAWKRLEMTNLRCSKHGNFTALDAQKAAYRRSLDLNKQQALRLFESTKIHVSHRENLEEKGFFTAFREASNHVNAEKIKTVIIDPAMQTVKNTVASVKSVSANVVKQGWNTIWESVNDPATMLKNVGNIFNAKTIPVGLLFAAGYPAAAMNLAQKDIKNNQVNTRKKRSIIRSPYLERIINAPSYKDWPRYNSYLNEIIKALEDELVASRNRLSYPIKSKIFWFLRNFDKPFTQEQSKKIYQIVQKVLAQKDSELFALKENDLSILEDILILAKTTFPYSDKDHTIFTSYIDAAKNNKSLIYTKKAGTFITQLFDTFETYLPKSMSRSELLDLLKPIQSLIDTHLVWNKNDPVAMLVQALSFLKKIRKKYKADTEVTNFIDEYAKEISEKAIKLIPAKFFDYPKSLIKEDIGAAYVKGLEVSDRRLFKGLYEIRMPKDSLPYSETRGVRGTGRSPNFNIEISYDQLSDAKKVEAFQMAREAYLELERLMTSLDLSSVRKGPINIQIKLFNENKHFERDGHMVFDVDSSGGGVCIPGEGDTVGIAFIYQTEQGFLNFKHEVTHALMMHFFGKNYGSLVPGAFVEGIADFIDKGSVNPNKMNVLRRMFEKNEIKPLSEVVTLNEGGSIVYTWGYFWLKYMIEEGAQGKIATIFSAIQKQDKAEVTRLIDEYGRMEANHFKRWIVKLNQDYTPAVPTRPAHDNYMQDLQKSQELLQFIKRNSGLKFIFKNDTVFLMEEGKLFIYRGKASRKEIANSSDYHWLMEALVIDVIETKLKQLGQREKTIYQGIISSMLGREEVDSYLDAYTEKQIADIQNGNSISLREDSEAASALEDFILRTNKKLHWTLNHAYPRVRKIDHSSFEKILKLEIEEREARKFAEENGFNLDNPAAEQPYKPDYSNKNTNNASAEKWASKKIELPREVIDLKNALAARDKDKAADLISKIDFSKFYINTQFNGTKNTLLHLAILANDPHVVWRLVYSGACLTIKNAQGKVPYDLVTSENKDNIANFINNALQRSGRQDKSNTSPEKKPTTKNSFDRSTQLPPLFPTKPIEFIPSATNPPQIEGEPGSALPMIIGGGLALTTVLGLGGLGYYFSRKRNNRRKMIAKSIVGRDFPRYPQNTAQAEELLGIQVDNNPRDNHFPMQSFSVGSLSENFERGRLEAFNEEFSPLFPQSPVDSVSSEEDTYFLPHPPAELLSRQRTSYSSDSTYNNGDSGRGSSLASPAISSNLERDMFLFRLTTINASLKVLQNKLQAFPENIRSSVAFSRMFTEPLTNISHKLDEAMSAHYDPLIFRTSLESFIAENDENKDNSLKTIERYLSFLESNKSKGEYKALFNDFRAELIIQINYLNFLAKKWSEVLSPGFLVTAENEIAKADSRILLTRKTMSLVRGYFCQLERLTSEEMESELNLNNVRIALQALKSIFFHADLENITDKPFPNESSQFIAQCALCGTNFDLAAKQLLTLGQEILNINNKELRGNFSKTHQLFEKLCQQNNYFFTNRIDFTKGKQEGLKDGITVALKFSAQTAHRLEETTSKPKISANKPTNLTAGFRNRHAFHKVNGENLDPVYENSPSNSFR
ncbi:MAG: collagenase [Pseudomonadota bacterium]